MDKFLSSLTLLFVAGGLQAQLALAELKYYVGSGSDTTALIIDFKDGTFDSSYVWGYLYTAPATGEDMLNAIWAADENLEVNIDTASFGNFLQDVSYNEHAGLGGAPNYWSTWEGPDMAGLISNNGIASTLMPGGIFGISYTDFNPAVAPGLPIPAYNPRSLPFSAVNQWVGTGPDSLVMIIDFNDSNSAASYAWGYLFTDSVSYLQVISDIEQQEPGMTVSISGAVTSISYSGHSGMVGALSDWYVWEAENFGNWRLRYVDEVYLHPGDYGALVYTRFLIPQRPVFPINVQQNIGLPGHQEIAVDIYPNPATTAISIGSGVRSVKIYDMSGKEVITTDARYIELSDQPAGIYQVELLNFDGSVRREKLMIR